MENFEAAQDKAAGRDRVLLLFSSSAEMVQRVGDYSKLPAAVNNTQLQDEDGNFYFMFGYSAIDGPDIIP
jgi:hypothetical protein